MKLLYRLNCIISHKKNSKRNTLLALKTATLCRKQMQKNYIFIARKQSTARKKNY